MSAHDSFPSLPMEKWEASKDTLQLYMQIVGKIRLKTFPRMNHWWHVPFYVHPRGITTRPIPYGDIQFEMLFDFMGHELVVLTTGGDERRIGLQDGLTVADFHGQVFEALGGLGIRPRIWAVPYDVPDISRIPFSDDTAHSSYDPEYVNRFWRVLVQVESVFEEFRGRFIGKSTPPHLFWHHMDLALTRFSGKRAPERPGANVVEREAYSHEVLSFGWWAGDKTVREPAFYAYAYPVPEGLYDEPLGPAGAAWNRKAGMALYRYEDMRASAEPRSALLEFLESAYQGGAGRLGWDTEDFRLPA